MRDINLTVAQLMLAILNPKKVVGRDGGVVVTRRGEPGMCRSYTLSVHINCGVHITSAVSCTCMGSISLPPAVFCITVRM